MLKADQEIQSHHTIVCDNEYLQELGLGSFTSGELYTWLTKKNNKNEYINLNPIRDPETEQPFQFSDPPTEQEVSKAANILLGAYKGDGEFNSLDDYEFTYWEKKGRTGEWVRVSIAEYPNLPCSSGGRGSFLFDKFNNSKITTPDYSKVEIDYTNNIFKYDGQQSNLFDDIAIQSGVNLDTTICNLIEMNNYARISKTVAAEDFWKKTKRDDKYSFVPETINFIRDIQTSREKYIEWSGIIPFAFYSNAFNPSGCIKESWVKYKLYLYNLPKQTTRKVAINNPVIVQKPQNAFGQVQNISTTDQPEVPASLNLTYDSISNKYESGTQQSLAIIVTDIAAAEQESIDFLLSQPIAFINSPSNSIGTTVGSALPITNWNENPVQWGPPLSKPGSDDTVSKSLIKIFNPTRNSFKKNDMVMLQRINGVWIPSPLDIPTKSDSTIGFEGHWDFTYLMTNSLFYFITKPKVKSTFEGVADNDYKLFTYDEYESSFRSAFHKKIFNSLQEGSIASKYKELNPFDDNKILDVAEDGYLHITSWDFMRKNMGGTRDFTGDPNMDFNILGRTVVGYDTNETFFGSKYRTDPGSTDPFFGCVFPNGYDQSEVINRIELTRDNTPIKANAITSIFENYSPYLLTFPSSSGFFEDKCINSSSDDKGVFHGITQGKYSLMHLPADIGTNCAPANISSTKNYGAPITNRYLFHKYMTTSSGLNNFNPEEFFSRSDSYFWLHPDSSPGGTVSFLNLKPADPRTVQFRPLKMETYASFDAGEPGELLSNAVPPPKRQKFLDYANRLVKTLFTPDGSSENDGPYFNRLVYNRAKGLQTNRKVQIGEFSKKIAPPEIQTKTGLSYCWLDMGGTPSDGETYFADIYTERVTGNYNQQIWNSAQGFQGAPGQASPGVVGIIGASAKFKLPTTTDIISIKTENYFGSFLGALPLRSPTWGTANDNYNSFLTTTIWMRVFTSWPKHLTIYDPRFFSVHHFNYGLGKLADNNIDINEVDLKWPTQSLGCSPTTGLNEKTIIDDFNFLFFSNSEVEPKNNWIRRTDDNPNSWYDGKHRRGKLLPYKYKKFSIGISTRGATSEDDFTNDIGIELIEPGSTVVSNDTTGIFLVNRGKNYMPGDILTTTGGSGSGVLLRVDGIDANGGIYSLSVVSPGKDFSHTDFMKKGVELSNKTLEYDCAAQQKLGLVKLINKTVKNNGEGVVGYVISGRLVSSEEEDAAPIEVINATRITPSSNSGENGMVQQDYYSNIPLLQRSGDGIYDFFFHFHGDVSYNMSYYGTTYNFDQFINLQIL